MRRSATRWWRGVVMAFLLVVAGGLAATPAHAEETPDELFLAGTESLQKGHYQDAIDRFEAFADRAPSHPDASFNRGLAYVVRIQNGDEKPGDLGRAAAAFEEVLALRPGDAGARAALGRVQGEVARRRARKGQDSLLAKPTLDRVVVQLASERSWGIAAIVSAWLLALGLILRQRPPGALHLAGTLLLPASLVLLLALLPLYFGARDLRLNTRAAVVVVGEAHFTDQTGKAVAGDPIPEAARLEVREQSGRFVFVRYGSSSGWIPLNTVHMIRTR